MKGLRGKPVSRSVCAICGGDIVQANNVWLHTDLTIQDHEPRPTPKDSSKIDFSSKIDCICISTVHSFSLTFFLSFSKAR